MDDVKKRIEEIDRTGPSSVTGDTKGSFASEGGYGRGPMGRGPYDQPDTYATDRADRIGPGEEYTEEMSEAAEESNREGNKERSELNTELEGRKPLRDPAKT